MTDTYVVDAAGKPVINKDPNATLDYSWNWEAWLAEISDTIDSFTVTPADDTVNVVSSSATTDTVTAFIAGGNVGSKVGVTCRIVTVGGRTDDRTIYLKIKER